MEDTPSERNEQEGRSASLIGQGVKSVSVHWPLLLLMLGLTKLPSSSRDHPPLSTGRCRLDSGPLHVELLTDESSAKPKVVGFFSCYIYFYIIGVYECPGASACVRSSRAS